MAARKRRPQKSPQVAGFFIARNGLLELHFLVDHMLTHDGIELLEREFFGRRFLVLGRGVEVTGAGCRFEFDFFTHDLAP
jgi:hypothetical protein